MSAFGSGVEFLERQPTLGGVLREQFHDSLALAIGDTEPRLVLGCWVRDLKLFVGHSLKHTI